MQRIDPATLTKTERYRLIIDSVVPRPIAWITTRSNDGLVNLAPFSYFMGVGSSPPSVAVSIGARNPPKDTLANLRANGECVVHLVPEDCLAAVNASGAEYSPTVSEVDELGLATAPSERVGPPRLEVATVALECRMLREVPVGDPPASLCVLEVVLAHVADAVAREGGLPDPHRHRALARLGGTSYLAADDWTVVDVPRAAPPDGKGR